ncbi:hypothetical protein [Bremerella sp.]|uniref:hypothetical protein n=1 Tax=Bremerella sp. TaxID=2795602 RepID=UPI00391D8E86
MTDPEEGPLNRVVPAPRILHITNYIAAIVYALGAIGAAILWKPLSLTFLLLILVIPGIAAFMLGLRFAMRLNFHGPLVLLFMVLLPLFTILSIGLPVALLAWLLSL